MKKSKSVKSKSVMRRLALMAEIEPTIEAVNRIEKRTKKGDQMYLFPDMEKRLQGNGDRRSVKVRSDGTRGRRKNDNPE